MANNTLRQGKRGQAGTIRVAIAGSGHVLGMEDFLNNRRMTTSVRCISDTGLLHAISGEDFFRVMSKDTDTWSLIGKSTMERDEAVKGKLIDTGRNIKKHNEPISIMDKPQGFGKMPARHMDKKSFLNVIQRYNMRINDDRLEDFRSTIKEIVDANIHGIDPKDKNELDTENYGRDSV